MFQRIWIRGLLGVLFLGLPSVASSQNAKIQIDPMKPGQKKPAPKYQIPPPPDTILQPGERPIDLATALKLAHVENPELLLARQRVVESVAVKQLAAAQLLPNVNVGTNYDLHRGALQQSPGNILKVNRDALYVGLGANAVGAGTVNIPGLNYNLNIGDAWYSYLAMRQRTITADASSAAVRNDVLLRVCLAYADLLRGEARQAIAWKNRDEAITVARLTYEYAQTGQGRKADADRAAVELKRRDADFSQAEAETVAASARLSQLLNLDPATRLKPVEGWAVPAAIVPDAIPLPDLLAISLMQRPEMAARRSEVQTALYEWSLAKVLPFTPNVILGFSAGGFGGGSNLVASPQGFIAGDGTRFVAPRFSSLEGRTDFDAVVYWTFRNLGVGNIALMRASDSRAKQSKLRELETLNLVRAQVAESRAWVLARSHQIDAGEKALRSSQDAFAQDLVRIRGGQGLPLELIDSMRLLGRARYEYLDSIIDYNRAQFQLWVAVGQPPANVLARPIPAAFQLPSVANPANLPAPRMMPAPRIPGS
jgi:outer membrane protein TolC